jgi:hypothetical protein
LIAESVDLVVSTARRPRRRVEELLQVEGHEPGQLQAVPHCGKLRRES